MIILIGDSWGVGEWGLDGNEFCLTGPGIGQYLSLHNTVVNLSVGSGSNTESINRLENFLRKYQVDINDTVYWIVTDPLRCQDTNLIHLTESFQSKVENLLMLALLRANKLAEKCSVTINLIGGLCDLDLIDLSNYNNLKNCVPSWGKLIDPEYQASIFCNSKRLQDLAKTADTSERKQEFLSIAKLVQLKEKSKIFTQNHFHPSRHGHRILRDHLYPEWKHIF